METGLGRTAEMQKSKENRAFLDVLPVIGRKIKSQAGELPPTSARYPSFES